MGRSSWLAELIAGQKSVQARKGQPKYCDRRDDLLDQGNDEGLQRTLYKLGVGHHAMMCTVRATVE